jgi:hypothetical protein
MKGYIIDDPKPLPYNITSMELRQSRDPEEFLRWISLSGGHDGSECE